MAKLFIVISEKIIPTENQPLISLMFQADPYLETDESADNSPLIRISPLIIDAIKTACDLLLGVPMYAETHIIADNNLPDFAQAEAAAIEEINNPFSSIGELPEP